MNPRLARLIRGTVETKDRAGDRAGRAGEKAALVGGVVVVPILKWLAVAIGAAYVLTASFQTQYAKPGEHGYSANRPLSATIAVLGLLALTGFASQSRTGGRPAVGAKARGLFWLTLSAVVSVDAWRFEHPDGGRLAVVLLPAVILGITGARKRRDRREGYTQVDPRRQRGSFVKGAVTGALAVGGPYNTGEGLGAAAGFGALVVVFGVMGSVLAATGLASYAGVHETALVLGWAIALVVPAIVLRWWPDGTGGLGGKIVDAAYAAQPVSAQIPAQAAGQRTAPAGTGFAALGETGAAYARLRSAGIPIGTGGPFAGQITYPDGSSGTWHTSKPHLLCIGAPGTGKTSSLLVPNVLAWQGSVISTSTKQDVAAMSAGVRSLVGTAFFWDPSGDSELPAYCQRLLWSPLMSVHSHDDAVWAAEQLLEASAVQRGGGSGAEQHFRQRAQRMLAPLLMAGVLMDRRMSKVVEWSDKGPSSWPEAEEALRGAGETRLADWLLTEITGAEGEGGREIHSAVTTMQGLLRIYSTNAALNDADAATFDPRAFIRTAEGWPTVYVVTSAGSRAAMMAPLVALFVSSIIEQRRRTYSSEDSPLLLAMDEIAAVPVPGLSSFVSNDRAIGVSVLACTQTDKQLIENPLYGSSLLTGFNEKVLFQDSGSPDLHQQVENASTKTRTWLANAGESESAGGAQAMMRTIAGGVGANQGLTNSQGASQHETRLVDRAEVVGALRRGQVRLLQGFRPLTAPMIFTDPVTGHTYEDEGAVVLSLSPADRPGIWQDLRTWAEDTHATYDQQGVEVLDEV